jgi:hypothetical protein
MGNFVITSSSLNNQYTYNDESVSVSGAYSLDATNHAIQSINGQVYAANENGGQGEYIGSFNGYMRNDGVYYTLSEMPRRKANLVWNAIDAIEAAINGENE